MKIIEKLLLLVSWLILIFILVFVLWGITGLLSSRAAFCSNFPLELSFVCASVDLLLSQFTGLILNYKFEIFGFAFESLWDILLLVVISGIGTTIFIRMLAKLLRRRRLRLRGFFVDLPGFSPIENDHPTQF
jgi:hypothetical protein